MPNHEEKVMGFLASSYERFPDRFWTLAALPTPRYLTERELEMAERRGEVERNETADGLVGWRYVAS